MLELVIEQRRRDLGGFEVGRVLPFAKRRMIGPFIFFDHMGPVEIPAGAPATLDVRPHPHVCLSTVTYLLEGEITHRDSLGVEQVIRPGEVNWMTAGRGISHSERFETLRQTGGPMHGIQAWVALPDGAEETEPAFQHVGSADLPLVDGKGWQARLIAGQALGAASPVTTFSPLFYLTVELQAGARFVVPDGMPERALYVAIGEVDHAGVAYSEGRMLVFRPGRDEVVAAQDSTLFVLGGEPLGQRHIWWNFVASSKQRIEQAKADWKAGRIPLPPHDNQEHIPLPEDPPPPAPPMS
jgi:redox-sensitive bicupin YhaK (pirin superfamily)